MFKRFLIAVLLYVSFLNAYSQNVFTNGKLEIHLKNLYPVEMDVYFDGKLIIEKIESNLEFSQLIPMEMGLPVLEESVVEKNFVDPVPLKFKSQTVSYKRIFISISYNLGFEILMSENTLNYRWLVRFRNENKIKNEIMQFSLAGKDMSWFPKEESLISHYERLYLQKEVDSIGKGDFCSLPVLFEKESGPKILFTEADLYNYPGMFLEKSDSLSFKAKFPGYVIKTKPTEKRGDRNQIITADTYISNFVGERSLPWRCFIIADDDADLLTNTTVYQLSRENKREDFSWVKPGKVAWDWWNANNITGVDFESGINNETYKYYIDFASEYGLEYIILDEGWSKTTTNIMECTPEIDVPELVKYGAEKNVGIILWTLWKPLNEKMEEVLDLYESWGVKGVKVDFMQRADQAMVEFYERTAKETAKRHLLVDFHGAFKPAGLRRAYPNVINYEGVKGLENVKWSKLITPEHNLTIPFTRMLAGPMDYTPGAMINTHEKNFAIRWERPMSMGTRCHQVAMYVVYEAPLQMLCDAPTNYYKEEETTRFISRIPTIWDSTIIFEAQIGSHLLLAKRNGEDWFIGGMTVEPKEFEIGLSFLEEGKYEIQVMQDGINSDKNAEDYRFTVSEVSQSDKLKVEMHQDGGYAAIIRKME